MAITIHLQAQNTAKAPISQPLVSHIYTADPSAHVFNDKIFIYGSHDIESGAKEDDEGGHFDMSDYHILSMNKIGGKVRDYGVALDKKDIPWAGRQLWAPDVAYKNRVYYLYFPIKDKEDVFKIGVATSRKPQGPFVAEKNAIEGSFSIDPAVFKDEDGSYYMYFGGIWGGQLQRWASGSYDAKGALRTADQEALAPKVAKLSANMLSFTETPRDIKIVDENGNTFKEGNNDKRFFEASWLHKYKGKYYFSYSTGDTHNICYAIGNSPYGPFTYKGIVLKPVQGWTNHHSIIQYKHKWYLFYHDTQLSGKTHLRNMKVTALKYNADGTIQTIEAYK